MKKVAGLFIFLGLTANLLTWPLMALAQSDPTPADTPSPTEVPFETITPTITETPILTASQLDGQATETPTPTETPEASPSGEMSIEPVPSEPAATMLVVVSDNNNNPPSTDNSTIVNNTNVTVANSGSNQINTTGSDQATVVTGQAVALANLINVVNTNSNAQSTVKIYLLNNLNGQVGQIDLNTAWNLLNNNNGNINVLTVDTTQQNNVSINNSGSIQNQVTVTADSGINQINGGSNNSILTGNAYALANVLNLLNINLQNSRLFLGVINVDGSSLGDIILPNPEGFLTSGPGAGTLNGTINNSANIDSLAISTADSGNNQISGGENNFIGTGNATALANILTINNLNLVSNNQLLIGLNTLGNWTGQIYNWGTPGTVEAGSISNLFALGGEQGAGDGSLTADINNNANISNWVLARAITGNNSINGGGSNGIQTGEAWSLVNVANFANLNLFGSSWFYGVINVVGNWNGNVIFAYPDLTMSMALSNDKPNIGEETDITINFANIGYDDSGNDTVEVDLPGNLQYLGDNSGVTPNINGGILRWQFGNMPAKIAKSFVIRARLTNEQTALNNWIIQPVMAAESSEVINGTTSTSRTEVTTNNNSAAVTVYLNSGSSASNDGTKLWPKLTITEKNNVNNWVYKNDVVTFEIGGKNEGEAAAYNSYLDQKILDSKGNVLTENKMDIGTIDIGQEGKITFGIPIAFDIKKDEVLTSQTQLVGYTQNNDEVKSNMTSTSFLVKVETTEKTAVVGVVRATDNNLGVLGATTTQPIIDLLPYGLLFIMSTFWILKQTKKWLAKK